MPSELLQYSTVKKVEQKNTMDYAAKIGVPVVRIKG